MIYTECEIGKNKKNISRVGYGTWPLSGDVNGSIAYGKTNDEDSKRALLKAFEYGVNVFDTADFYGFGHVEKLLGSVFVNNRHDITIITKVGLVSLDSRTDFTTEYMIKSIEKSLKNLQTDYIDVYLLHDPHLNELEDGRVISVLDTLKLEGKIIEYGISTRTPIDSIESIQKYGFKFVEFNYNVMDHRAKELGVLDLCYDKNVFSIIRTPLSQGIITGNFSYTNDISDKRNQIPKSKVDNMISTYEKMCFNIKNKNKSKSQVALQFCLSQKGVSCVIPGMKYESEVIENIGCLEDYPLSEEEIHHIEHEYKG